MPGIIDRLRANEQGRVGPPRRSAIAKKIRQAAVGFSYTVCVLAVSLAHGHTVLVPNDPSVDNGPLLSQMLREAPGRCVSLPAGEYHFQTAPDLDLPSWAIVGPAPIHAGYGYPNKINPFASFVFHGDGVFLDAKLPIPTNYHQQRGPFVLTNLFLLADSPRASLLLIGNTDDTKKQFIQSHGIDISGCTFWLSNQLWSGKQVPSNLSILNPDATIDREAYRGFGIRIVKGYRTVIQDTDLRGGFLGVDLVHCDRPALRNVHAILCGYGFKSKKIGAGNGAVPGTWDVYAEDCNGVGLWSDSSVVHNYRAETGYHGNVGEFDTPITSWSIEALSDRIMLDMAGDARDYFEPDFPVKIVTNDGRTLYLLVEKVAADHLTFCNANYQCKFEADTSGEKIYRYFATTFVMEGPRAILAGGQSWGLNRRLPNLPIGFVSLKIGRSRINGTHAGWGNFNRSNAVAVIGHNKGHPRHDAVVDYFGGADIYVPEPSDFVNRIP